ncbi:MAG: hypothetical protein QS98_C0003G0057 [archaeon GW2011_AR3]|nr:MAG: hypothetical protein QS98_C0003G0057 [archaeon GW2011_AR3]
MNPIVKIIKELRGEVFKVVILESFLDATLVFLGVFMVLSLLNLRNFYALAPAILALFVLMWYRIRQFRLKTVEERNPVVREMLRTAADNASRDNFVVRALNMELVDKMRKVSSSSLMNTGNVVGKLIGIVVLAILTVYVSATQFHLFDLNKLLYGNLNPIATEGSLSDIYGDKTPVPKIGSNPVDIKLNPLSYEININKIDEAKKKEFRSDFPVEVFAAQEKSYEENIPREQQIIVRNYFASIKK